MSCIFVLRAKKRNQGIHSLVPFFVLSKGDEPLAVCQSKQQKFAVAGISEFLQTPSANSGSEPGNFIGSNYRRLKLYRQLEALAESLTRAFRFLVEKRGRPDREKTRPQDAFRRLVG